MPDIAVWNKCDNRCEMCTNTDSFAAQDSGQYSLKEQIRKFEKYLRGENVFAGNPGNRTYINLTGGEPTLHPDFLKLVSYYRRRVPGVRITLLTNGRRFADSAFVSSFAAAAKPPFNVAFALHGSNPRLHDSITGVPGSFSEALKGIRNFLRFRKGQGLEMRCVLTGRNIADFPRMLDFLENELPESLFSPVVFIHYEIEGKADEKQDEISLRLSESASEIARHSGRIKAFSDFRLYHFPLCVLPVRLRKYAWVTLPEEDRVYTGKCGSCALRGKCLGLMKEYYRRFGDGEIGALK